MPPLPMSNVLTPKEQAVSTALQRLEAALVECREARDERDAAILALYDDDWTPGRIARFTGMSVSNVRLITDPRRRSHG